MAKVSVTVIDGNAAVGRNNATMVAYEDGDQKDAVVIDWGQTIPHWGSPEEEHEARGRGGDLPDDHYPDPSLLHGYRVLACLYTHGHLDHIGGNHRIHAMYPDAVAVMDPFTMRVMRMVNARERRPSPVNTSWADWPETIQIGPFQIQPFPVNHSIQGACGYLVGGGGRRFAHFGDSKSWPVRHGRDRNEEIFGYLRDQGKIDLALVDVTNVFEPNFVFSEDVVRKAIGATLAAEPGRVFLAYISSNTPRIDSITHCCWEGRRPLYAAGGNMRGFFQLVGHNRWDPILQRQNPGRLDPPPSKWRRHPVICVTGGQGEEYSFLDNLAEGRFPLPPKPGDVLIIAADTIPTPEVEARFVSVVEKLTARFERIYLTVDTPPIESRESRGAEIIRSRYLHASGHGKRGDIVRVLDRAGMPPTIGGHSGRDRREEVVSLVEGEGGEAYVLDNGESIIL